MQSIIIHRIATTAVMPLVAASGWAGYSYYTPNQPVVPQVTCTVLTTDLYYNSYGPGSDVTSLQRFLAGKGYLQATPTGYFGPATRMGVSRFQADHGMPPSGAVDWQTRELIQEVTCTNTGPQNYGYDQQYHYPPQDTQLSIQGIDAPQTLSVGESGSWTVRVIGWNDRSGGTLRYSVTWGDEDERTRASSDYRSTSVQSSGTFTHTYTRAGTYTPVFTVTDSYGNRVTARATTQVRGSSYHYQDNSYCTTSQGWNDRSCQGNDYQYSSSNGCTDYYDRNCYQNDYYRGTAYNSSNDTCYFVNGEWKGNCGSGSAYEYNSYTGTDYSCYYDRACLARLTGRSY